jgi:hypothetical protein
LKPQLKMAQPKRKIVKIIFLTSFVVLSVLAVSAFNGWAAEDESFLSGSSVSRELDGIFDYPNLDAAREDTTLVTAYFYINRDKWGAGNRTEDIYIKHGTRVLAFRNRMVIYTTKEFAPKVREMRENNGLLSRTTIIENTFESLYYYRYREKIQNLMKSDSFKEFMGNFSILPEYCEPDYDIVTFSKYSLLEETISRGYQKSNYYIWVDFGMYTGAFPDQAIGSTIPLVNDAIYRNNKKIRLAAFAH